MMQIPNLPNYVQVPQQPNYNAVKIDVHNPMVNVPAQAPAPASQYEAPTMPYYNYPQAQTQPYYMPPVITTPETQQQAPVVVPPAVEQAPAQEVPVQPAVVPPAPVVTQEVPVADEKKSNDTVKTEAPVEVVPSEEIKPQVDINEFIAKLTNPDYDTQAAAMEEIANLVDKDPKKASDLIDSKVFDTLTGIITADTSAVEDSNEAQAAAKQKLASGQELTPEEKTLAETLSPKEKAERNKSFAMYTTAILQKLYGEEYAKMSNATVPLTELPGAVTVVQQLKSNPNPKVRTSAIESLSYIQEPSYKKDLNTIFTIAQNDVDPDVQNAAKAALAKLNEVADAPAAEQSATAQPADAQPAEVQSAQEQAKAEEPKEQDAKTAA